MTTDNNPSPHAKDVHCLQEGVSPTLRGLLDEVNASTQDKARRQEAVTNALSALRRSPRPSTPEEWVNHYNAELALMLESGVLSDRAAAPKLLESYFREVLTQRRH